MPGQDLVQPTSRSRCAPSPATVRKRFYEGPVAEKIVAAVRKAGGIMTTEDLKNYRVERAPVRGTYRGYDIVSMPPPSSGGVHLIEMLNILEGTFRCRAARALAATSSPDDRGDEARLRGPRGVSWRSGFREGAGRGP